MAEREHISQTRVMEEGYDFRFDSSQESPIRDLLNLPMRDGFTLLGGGYPDRLVLPNKELQAKLLDYAVDHYENLMGYGKTIAYEPLQRAAKPFLETKGVQVTQERIVSGAGSQALLAKIGQVLILQSNHDAIAVCDPVYLGAIQAFQPYEPTYVQIESDDEGMSPSSLRRALENDLIQSGGDLKKRRIKFIYDTPTFGNPSGKTQSDERRRDIAAIVEEFGVYYVEDDPYGSLAYDGTPPPAVSAYAKKVGIYITTFSKILAPAMRTGIMVGPEAIVEQIIRAKQGDELCSSNLLQGMCASYLNQNLMPEHIRKTVELYHRKRDIMQEALTAHFPESAHWIKPTGGMFFFVTLDGITDMRNVFKEAVNSYNVAFVRGEAFYTEKGKGLDTMRLNFTYPPEEELYNAVQRLSVAIKDSYAQR